MNLPPLTNVFPAPKILLMGESGTGKTYAIRTLIDAGITPFCIFTEPGMETLIDIPQDKWHWAYVSPTVPKWDALRIMVSNVNKLSYENLLKVPDPHKMQYTHFFSVLKLCEEYVEHSGKSWGDVTTWGNDRALVIDSLSGLSDMAMQMVAGLKAARAMHEWGEAQTLVEALINKLVTDCKCMFILTAHIERENDEISGGSRIMVSTLGRKLAPRLPRYFSDVIQTIRDGDKFTWSTAGFNVATKARNLPIADKLPPSFVPLLTQWRERSGQSST